MAATWDCPRARWEIPRLVTPISVRVAWWRWTWVRSTWRSRTARFSTKEAIVGFAEELKKSGEGVAHLIGLVSDGGVHSHQSHISAAARALVDRAVPVIVHVVTDGRDVPPTSAEGYLAKLLSDLPDGVRIGTVSGRYFAMDRDNRWDRVEKAYRAMVLGDADRLAEALVQRPQCSTAFQSATTSTKRTNSSTLMLLAIMAEWTTATELFFINFRADRAREILRADR